MTEWEFYNEANRFWLVHNCKKNPRRFQVPPGQHYVWNDTTDRWNNKNLHCYVCNAEPPGEIITQALLIPVQGLKKHD